MIAKPTWTRPIHLLRGRRAERAGQRTVSDWVAVVEQHHRMVAALSTSQPALAVAPRPLRAAPASTSG